MRGFGRGIKLKKQKNQFSKLKQNPKEKKDFGCL